VPKAPAWLALALAAGALVPRFQWLVLQASPEPALARIEAWAEARPPSENPSVAATLEFAAMIHYRDGRADAGNRAMASAVARVPSARLHLEWAMAESMRGDWSRAQSLFEHAIALAPRDPATWIIVADAASEHGDRAWLERAARELRGIDPANPRLKEMEAALGR
jgi:Flp pilus assembly protein TadD